MCSSDLATAVTQFGRIVAPGLRAIFARINVMGFKRLEHELAPGTIEKAVLVAGSEKAAAQRLGLSHSTVKHHLANAGFQGRSGDDRAVGVDPGVAPAGARRHGVAR